jgi:hypothetical protein
MIRYDICTRALLVTLIVSAACDMREVDKTGIQVPSDATMVKSSRGFEENGVEYVLSSASGPAVVEQISKQLAGSHWLPTSPLWDNVETAGSYVQGWYCYPDDKGVATFQWIADWRNRNGDVVTYIVKTRDRHLGNATLEVLVSIIHSTEARHDIVVVEQPMPNTEISAQCRHVLNSLSYRP